MRRLTDAAGLERLMRRLGEEADREERIYLTGGATAVLLGWRPTTVDVDLKLDSGDERLLRAFPRIKDELQVNLELASPADFIPELPGWRDRSLFIRREGLVDFYHYDLHAQALAKIERGHTRDLLDVREMIDRGHIDRRLAIDLFREIEPRLYRYPAVDPAAFRRGVEAILGAS